ncbi:MAG: acyloxyacyl hydrolase [Pseudomonadota bacterium]
MKLAVAVFVLLVTPLAVSAQDYILGLGYTDFNRVASEDTPLIVAEYHLKPFYETDRLSANWALGLTAHTSGDFHVGFGLASTYSLGERWFLEGSVLPGGFFENDDANFLGGHFQIRSLFGLGYGFDNGNKISLGVTHISNASTTDENPGVNSVQVRFRRAF